MDTTGTSSSSNSFYLEERSINEDDKQVEEIENEEIPSDETHISFLKIAGHLVLTAIFYTSFLSLSAPPASLKVIQSVGNLIYFLLSSLVIRYREKSADLIEQVLIAKQKAKYPQQRLLKLILPIGLLIFLIDFSKFYIFDFTVESGHNLFVSVALLNIDIVIVKFKKDMESSEPEPVIYAPCLVIIIMYFAVASMWLSIEIGLFILLLALMKITIYVMLNWLESKKSGIFFSRRIFVVDGLLGVVLFLVIFVFGLKSQLPDLTGWMTGITATICYGLIFDFFRFFNLFLRN